MKYILLIYSKKGVWPPGELEVARDESVQLCHKLNDRAIFGGGAVASDIHCNLRESSRWASHRIGRSVRRNQDNWRDTF